MTVGVVESPNEGNEQALPKRRGCKGKWEFQDDQRQQQRE